MSESDRLEIARLRRMVEVLADRAERSTLTDATDFGQFQTTVVLEEQVRLRTAELQAALVENQRISRTLRESQALYEALVSQSLVGICCIEHGVIAFANPRVGEILGCPTRALIGRRPEDIVDPDDQLLVREQLRQRTSGESLRVHYRCRAIRGDGTRLHLEIYGTLADVAGRSVVVSVLQDVTDQVRAAEAILQLQAQLREQSTHDPLTGLFNRRQLDVSLPRQVRRALNDREPLAVVMCDLDHFKAVNDQHGHAAGDELLRVVARTLVNSTRPGDACYRMGGEEFLIILPATTCELAESMAQRLRQELRRIVLTLEDGSVIRVSGSFGYASLEAHALDAEELLARADAAVYEAKRNGRDCVCEARRGVVP